MRFFNSRVRDPKLGLCLSRKGYSRNTVPRIQLPPSPEAITEDDRNRIYILGLGNKGMFYGASLRLKNGPPPVTLLTANQRRADVFEERGKKIVMFEDGRDIEACGFDMEVIPKTFQAPLSDDSPIEKRTRTAPGSTTTVDSNRPILNLICAVRSKWAAPAIFKIKHRLRPNSAVFALAEGFGVLEEIWAMNFPDPITRPSFRFCLAKHGVWERAPGLERGANMYKDTVEDLFQGEAVHSTGFDIHHDISRGKLRIGPLAVDRNTSEPERFRREHDMEYFTNQLLDYPRLNALKVDQGLLLFHRYKKLVQDAVMGPLITHFECDPSELSQNEVAQVILDRMIKEAYEVVRRDVPNLPIEELYNWVGRSYDESPMHSMAIYTFRGMDTGIEKINGWLIDRARQFGFRLPTHERMMNIVILKTLERSKVLFEEQKIANRKSNFVSNMPEAKPYKDKIDRVDLNTVPKKQQPLPETYMKP